MQKITMLRANLRDMVHHLESQRGSDPSLNLAINETLTDMALLTTRLTDLQNMLHDHFSRPVIHEYPDYR